jgi:hypothetical protein
MKIEDRLFESQQNEMGLQKEVNMLIDELKDVRYLYRIKVERVEDLEVENTILSREIEELQQEVERLKKNK